MPFYTALDDETDVIRRRRTADGLLRLKATLADVPNGGVPDHTLDDRVLIATWNIREFDTPKHGSRGIEPMLYIAEIISAFDIIAIQEVREDLRAVRRLLRYLGDWWHILVTDVTRGRSGNFERLAFLYDTRKVRFGGLVGEVVRPRGKGEVAGSFVEQFARTPFLVGFQVGWLKFTICTAHIYYGTSKALDPRRLAEIGWLAKMLADRHLEKHEWADNIVLLGDFNIFDTTDATAKAITDAGFLLPPELQHRPSNLSKTKHYDQIAFYSPRSTIRLTAAGVFAWQDVVYTSSAGDEQAYAADRQASGSKLTYPSWRTYQMSDHAPMWVELTTDFSEDYLKRRATGGSGVVPSPAPSLPLDRVG